VVRFLDANFFFFFDPRAGENAQPRRADEVPQSDEIQPAMKQSSRGVIGVTEHVGGRRGPSEKNIFEGVVRRCVERGRGLAKSRLLSRAR